ncbi:MAG: HAD-IIB family hydrolase [Bdellovibrionaceae bacterium]|nr:HAD-IIB family hydrolase [Pseudobdellovibrionaceae bacterium]MBX3034458.1 HAD-IIB family hydrolase [Pseudobdellovibrionaceae bacterium]
MRKLSEFQSSVDFILTDIDDTLTDEGQLHAEAYAALWALHGAGLHVIPVTGRPAGWCEMIARMWPVAGVVGENGGFWFRYHERRMKRDFFFDSATIAANRRRLDLLQQDIPRQVPGSAVASDQFCRLMDLAIDFCEDVPALPRESVEKIVKLFEAAGAQAKVSSIHVNGWFGDYDKLTMARRFLRSEFSLSDDDIRRRAAFCGDSPNDEPMFAAFPHGFGVANIRDFSDRLRSPPAYIAPSRGGRGFAEIARALLKNRR